MGFLDKIFGKEKDKCQDDCCSYGQVSKSVEESVQSTLNLEKKIGEKPICYLTGIPIDINKPNEYSLDHIIPMSRGGKNTLENCGLLLSCHCIEIA